jgi:glucose/mannose transport system substrate-binding protein
MTADPIRHRWALKHAWHSESDRAALALCAEELGRIGVEFADAAGLADADAVKLHGFELVEAVREGALRLVDLRAVARDEAWTSRVDPRAWAFMVHGEAVHGIPMGIHRSNCVWANPGIADEIGAVPVDLLAWLRLASRRVAKPLAIGREPWQVGILFETLCLAALGRTAYARAFVDLDPGTLGGREMTRVLERLLEFREWVDDARLDAPWRTHLDDVHAGRAAAMLTGDWVRASGKDVRRLDVDDVRGRRVYIVDLFVPVGSSDEVSRRVAAALTASGFQARFSKIKGSTPAVGDGRDRDEAIVDAPSLTFDQCCPVRIKQSMLAVVAEHFAMRRKADATAARLAEFGVRPRGA